MSEEEVMKAIERGKLPLNIIDRATVAGLLMLFIVFSVALCRKDFSFNVLYGIALLGSIYGLMIWNVIYRQKLTPYLSTLPFDMKNNLLENLAKEPNVKYIERKDSYDRLVIREDWTTSYTVTILYTESDYYINSTLLMGRIRVLSTDKTNDIIDRIKALEAQV